MTDNDDGDNANSDDKLGDQCQYHITPLAIERNEQNIRCPDKPINSIGGQFSYSYYDTGGAFPLYFELCNKHYLMINQDMDRILWEIQKQIDPQGCKRTMDLLVSYIIITSYLMLSYYYYYDI